VLILALMFVLVLVLVLGDTHLPGPAVNNTQYRGRVPGHNNDQAIATDMLRTANKFTPQLCRRQVAFPDSDALTHPEQRVPFWPTPHS
jgi:anaerobic selenocysteine-containing dehydrogenase